MERHKERRNSREVTHVPTLPAPWDLLTIVRSITTVTTDSLQGRERMIHPSHSPGLEPWLRR